MATTFKAGERVECWMRDEGLASSWYAAKVLRPKGTGAAAGSALLGFEQLLEDDDDGRHLEEWVPRALLRPVPPPAPDGFLEGSRSLAAAAPGEHLELAHEGGWWQVSLRRRGGGGKYTVLYAPAQLEHTVDASMLRPRWTWAPSGAWTHGKDRRKLAAAAADDATAELLKEIAAHESGEKLNEKIELARKARKDLGAGFVDDAQLADARRLAREVCRDQASNLRVLLELIRPAAPYMAVCATAAVVNCSLRGTFHQIGRWAEVVETAAAGDVKGAYALLFSLWFGHMVIEYVTRFDEVYGQRAESVFGRRIRNGVLAAMLRQDFEYFDRTAPGVLQERLNRDAAELGQNLIRFPQRLIHRLAWMGVNVYFLYHQTPTRLFCVSMLPLLVMIPLQYFVFNWNRRCHSRQRKVSEQAVAATSEILREIRTVRQFAMEPRESVNYARGELARAAQEQHMACARQGMDWGFWSCFVSALCLTVYLGVPYVLSGAMKASELLDAVFKINCNLSFPMREIVEDIPLMGKLLQPLGRICDLLQANPRIEPPTFPARVDAATPDELRAVLAKCEQVSVAGRPEETRAVLAEPIAAPPPASPGAAAEGAAEQLPVKGAHLIALSTADHEYVKVADAAALDVARLAFPVQAVFSRGLRPPRFGGRIEFRDVSFSYPTDLRKPVLDGLSFVVEPGQKVALVGATGCGKSSCMGLLQRLYEPTRGEILLDGVPLRDYDVHFLRSRVVIVDQSTVLFNATVRENVAYGLDDVSDEEVIRALKDARAWDFVRERPDQLMSVIADGGKNLSGGQRQRLAIARAMIRKPDVILLDEATSALDTENEALVQEALDEFARRGSALVIAHRLSTVMDSDKIVVVDHGRKAEEGRHDELLAKPHDADAAAADDDDEITSHEPPALERERTAPTPSIDSLALAADDDDASASSAPPKLQRSITAADATKGGTANWRKPRGRPRASYRRLWEAATGSHENMSLGRMREKAEQITKELALLNAKIDRMQTQKEALLMAAPQAPQ